MHWITIILIAIAIFLVFNIARKEMFDDLSMQNQKHSGCTKTPISLWVLQMLMIVLPQYCRYNPEWQQERV